MEAATFILFGSTGDLAKRKIYPALFNLYLDGKLPTAFSVIGLGRKAVSDAEFQSRIEQSIRSFSRRRVQDEAGLKTFLEAFRYSSLDIPVLGDYSRLLELVKRREAELGIPENRIFYMSVAPEFFGTIAHSIKESGLGAVTGWKRLIIEKPFGRDLATARELNAKLAQSFEEREIFRIDHYLGKPMIQNLEDLEYTNPILQALWTNRYIANVQITASETVGVEERAGYYDHYGAVRDMFQNHMLQILMMLALQLPKHSTADNVAFKKKLVLESLRPLSKEDVRLNVVRGQYTSGVVEGKTVPGYTEEKGIDKASANDTFIAARLWIDNYFWSEVPFYIRTGKRLNEKSTRIVIQFKDPLEKPNGKNVQAAPNLLIIEIGPEAGISFQLNLKEPNQGEGIEPIHIRYSADQKDVPEAYEKLFRDALIGDSTFFAHWDEVEMSWQWVQPILEAFEENLVPLELYPAGSNGPSAAHKLLQQDGYQWWLDPEDSAQGADSEPEAGKGSVEPTSAAPAMTV